MVASTVAASRTTSWRTSVADSSSSRCASSTVISTRAGWAPLLRHADDDTGPRPKPLVNGWHYRAMPTDDPWRDPDRQRWLLGLESLFGVNHLFQSFFGYHLDPADPEPLAFDRPAHRVMRAIDGSAGALLELRRPDVRDAGFAESLGDDVAGLALAHARVLHEGGPVDVDTVWAWAHDVEHGDTWVSGSALQDFLFTAVGLAMADPPAPLRDLFVASTPVPDAVRDARQSLVGIREALARHHGPPPASSPAAVQARSFHRRWRDLVRSYPADGR
jgi:hypothetical protein